MRCDQFFGVPSTIYPCSIMLISLLIMSMCVHEFLCCKILLLIKKAMSEELIYIVNGKNVNENKCKKLLGKNEMIGLRKK